jgi:hypothetical protein
MPVMKSSGPVGAIRPFIPPVGVEEEPERIACALEHIAVSLAAIDHNIELLVQRMPQK